MSPSHWSFTSSAFNSSAGSFSTEMGAAASAIQKPRRSTIGAATAAMTTAMQKQRRRCRFMRRWLHGITHELFYSFPSQTDEEKYDVIVAVMFVLTNLTVRLLDHSSHFLPWLLGVFASPTSTASEKNAWLFAAAYAISYVTIVIFYDHAIWGRTQGFANIYTSSQHILAAMFTITTLRLRPAVHGVVLCFATIGMAVQVGDTLRQHWSMELRFGKLMQSWVIVEAIVVSATLSLFFEAAQRRWYYLRTLPPPAAKAVPVNTTRGSVGSPRPGGAHAKEQEQSQSPGRRRSSGTREVGRMQGE
ncbi:hypothetical protein BCR44DRAFT_1437946 [Catenaria anguillulae PL171]|uniref:Uncharacterized protein n=1 Tax=Catenaria anguillulae PL171 TaxID=765915 RepID=A0A1Y2HGM3_9FUNG|nr:hypothetical protein BCR44DRAFT_1437946 [Catenaria anguillulae PL171]